MVSRRILIVEDEGLIGLDLQRRLEKAGYVVVAVAERMEEALEMAATLSPELVFMDIRIKGEHDGIETAGRLSRQYDLPVIYVTAHSDVETMERAKLTTPFGYIVKPFSNLDFRAVIEKAMTMKGIERKPEGIAS